MLLHYKPKLSESNEFYLCVCCFLLLFFVQVENVNQGKRTAQ